tara:strand:+ start:995 stop:3319 length:2325 start_codon:yes stop_codon:yes gene_type:complete
MDFKNWLSKKLPEVSFQSAQKVIELTEEGSTVPFIARYRKEATGNLDEVIIQKIIDTKEEIEWITKRQAHILEQIDQQKKLTPELKKTILETFDKEQLEELYLPYKQKRKTKAMIAKEAGLEPLAQWIWELGQGTIKSDEPLEKKASSFINEKLELPDVKTVLEKTTDILIEKLTLIPELREQIKNFTFKKGVIQTKKGRKATEQSKYEKYFDYQESIENLKNPQNSHRYLAIRRGWEEGELSQSIEGSSETPDFHEKNLTLFENTAIKAPNTQGNELLKRAALFAYKVYVFPSIEKEVHRTLKSIADEAAILVFTKNLRKLLLAPAFGPKSVLGIDPGIRTGCKVALVSDSGEHLIHTVIQLRTEDQKKEAEKVLTEAVQKTQIQGVAIGNGTAGRETESFVKSVFKKNKITIPVVMVSESGASIYSASAIAREEFPDFDLTVRGAISIARRLQDPLAELVKVDPKSIGVGQYQHDVSQTELKKSLGFVVDSCVNSVGVNLNTASSHLLSHISGISASLAKTIVNHREKKGLFKSREELLKLPRFSAKIFEQCAGFLRIPDGTHPLDNTGVHPERYEALENAAKRLQKKITDFIGSGASLLKKDHAFATELGSFTSSDIISELEKPGRDPREEFAQFHFREDIHEIKDLTPGMRCPGIVTNVTNFGAFVDIGVHQDGLVHISQLSDSFVKSPQEVVSPGDHVQTRVIEVNLEKKQIALSMKKEVTTEERAKRTTQPKKFQKNKQRTGPKLPPVQNLTNNPFAALASMKKNLKK